MADNPGVGSGQAHTNRASATTTDNAGFAGNRVESYVSNTPTADAFIDSADLEIRKLNAATPAIAGENYSWTLETRNLGDDPSVGPFTVVDTLPSTTPALTFVSATGTGWNCTEAPGSSPVPEVARCRHRRSLMTRPQPSRTSPSPWRSRPTTCRSPE